MAGNAKLQQRVLDQFNNDDCITLRTLVELTDLTPRQVSASACTLIRRGYLERAEVGCYRLTATGRQAKKDGKPLSGGPFGPLTQAKPRKRGVRTFRQRLWKAMRITAAQGQKFTQPDLIAVACQGNEKSPETNTTRYVRALLNAGYLRQLPRNARGDALTSNGFKRYALVRDTGPGAPVLRAGRGEVFDPNTEETISCRNG